MTWKDEMLVRRGKIEALEEVSRLAGMHCATEPFRAAIAQLLEDALNTAPVPHSGPDTSKAAALSMSFAVDSLRHKALAAYEDGPITDEECGIRIGHGSIWPRCSELRRLKLIEPNGEKRLIARTRLNGRLCAITDAGRAILRASRA